MHKLEKIHDNDQLSENITTEAIAMMSELFRSPHFEISQHISHHGIYSLLQIECMQLEICEKLSATQNEDDLKQLAKSEVFPVIIDLLNSQKLEIQKLSLEIIRIVTECEGTEIPESIKLIKTLENFLESYNTRGNALDCLHFICRKNDRNSDIIMENGTIYKMVSITFPRKIVEIMRDVTKNMNSKHVDRLLEEGGIKFIAELLKVDVLFTAINVCLDTLDNILLTGEVLYII